MPIGRRKLRSYHQYTWLLAVLLAVWWLVPAWALAQSGEVVITRLGLSRIRGTTLLTVILNRPAQPRITPVTDQRSPQLCIDFPQARVIEVPASQPGDHDLVQQVRISSLNGGRGVRVILDLVPDRPYVYWRLMRDNPAGGVALLVGLRPDPRGSQAVAPGLTLDRPAFSQPAPSQPVPAPLPQRPQPPPPESQSWPVSRPGRQPVSPPLVEIAQAVPASVPLLAFIEEQGWVVEQNHQVTKTGNRSGRQLTLTHSRLPDFLLQIETLSAKAAGGPLICKVTLSTANIDSDEARRYREMRRWSLATIKKHYEDIGDYYDDGLKPLRLILREQTKAVMLRNFDQVRQFLAAAVPQNPQLPDTVLKHLQEKTNKRLEGVQYTENTNPLVILDLVDFYTLRVYYIGS